MFIKITYDPKVIRQMSPITNYRVHSNGTCSNCSLMTIKYTTSNNNTIIIDANGEFHIELINGENLEKVR